MTTTIYDLFKTEADLETNGIDYQLTKNIKFRLARAGGANSKFTRAIDVKTRHLRKQIQAISDGKQDQETLDLLEELTQEAFAETVILGWEGMTDEAGEPLSFSKDAAVKLFKDMPDLWSEIRDMAMKMANFQAEALEEDAGN